MTSIPELTKLLNETSVEAILSEKRNVSKSSEKEMEYFRSPLITLSSHDSVKVAMKTLAMNHISSAPVYDSSTNVFLGFVDTLDLAVFVVNTFAETHQKHPHLYDPRDLDTKFEQPVRNVINSSKRNPFLPVEIDKNVQFLIDNFLKYGVHRVPVIAGETVVGIVSQLDIVRFLQRKLAMIVGNQLDRKLYELNMDSGNVISVRNDAPLMKVFTTILKHNISGVAIIHMKTGQIVGNISASDLKGITQDCFYKLEVPIHQIFLGEKRASPIVCTAQATLRDLLNLFVNTGVHRIYVVDVENKPTNAISLTDILKFFASEEKKFNPSA